MYEHITIVGNIGSAEVATSQAQEKYMKLTVAVNRTTKGKQTCTWYNVILYGEKVRNSDVLMDLFVKGRQVLINGRPTTKAYKKNDGTLAVDNTIHATALPVLMDRKPQAQ